MKRHLALRNLSVDHHHALVQAHRLQGAGSTPEATAKAILDAFLRFWREQANWHFREEEEALLPFFALYGDVHLEAIRQMQGEHILIRRDVAQLVAAPDSEPDVEAMHALGKALEAHVRLEERVVFPLIEQALPEDALARLPHVLAAWHTENKSREHKELE